MPLTAPPDRPRIHVTHPILTDVRAAQAGDVEAFARLYDHHVQALFAVCLGLTGNRTEAADLVQDTFVQAWRALPAFRGDSAFATWLHRIAVNCMLSGARTARRRAMRVAIEADLDRDGAHSGAEAVSTDSDPQLRLDIRDAVSRLPAGARAVFVMHDLGGYTHAEIATHLGIAEGTSKAHLFRARRLLRGMLER